MPLEHPVATRVTLAEPSRAEMLATLAAGTLHDVSHLLVLVLCNAELLLDDPALGDRSRRLVEDAIQAGERAEGLAQQMLSFARGDVDAPAGMVDVVAALRAAEPLARRVAGRSVDLAIEARSTPLWVRAEAVALDRIIVNLVANGRDAMPVGGRLRLRVAPAPARPGDHEGTAWVRITATDTGRGAPAAGLRERLAELDTITRSDEGHDALDLSVVRAVVGRLGGTVSVTGAPEGGTTFAVDLPAVTTPLAP